MIGREYPGPHLEGRMTNTLLFPRRLALGLILVAAALGSGCGTSAEALGGQGPQDPMVARDKYGSVVQLTVQNNDFKDATVYAVWEGMSRRRIGMVTGKTSATFTFDWVSHKIHIEADFVAGEGFTSDPIEVWEGDHLDLVIMNQG
jgi:hypothetical protein